MKFKNISIYALSVAGMMGLWSCSSEEAMPDVNVASGERVPITIVVSRDGDSGTRTELSEDLQNGGLTHTWSVGDELFLYDSNGADAGKVTLESGEGSAKGVFKGEVTATSGEYCLWYFGSRQSAAADADLAAYPYVTVSGGQVTLDLKAPKFESAADFSKVDVMSQKATINVNGNQATVAQTVTMQPHVALARFDLRNLPAGVTGTLKVYDTKAQTEGNINTKQVLSLSDGSVVRSEETEAYTFTDWSSDKDLYVAFVPYSSNLKFEYTYQKEVQEVVNGATVKNTYPIKNIHSFKENQNLVAGIYYQSVKTVEGSQAPTIGGVEVPFEIDDSDNPGNMDNWGSSERIYETAVKTSLQFSKYGRYTNCLDLRGWGGWGTWVKYSNGIINNLLTSYDGAAFYFQWGRLMGFPSNVKEEPKMYYANNTPLTFGEAGNPGYYISHYEFDYTNFSNDDSNKYPYVFSRSQSFSSSLDWNGSNPRQESWESITGNICPDGYRLPSASELSIFVPSDQRVYGSKVEYNSFKGIRYAIEWVVTAAKGTTPSFITIRMARTDRNDVKVNDDLFKDSKSIKLVTYGFIDQYGTLVNKGSKAIIWSNDTGENKSVIITNTSGYGGKALYVETNGTTAALLIVTMPRVIGGNVIPLKDNNSSKSVTYEPWFPYGAKWPN